MPGSNFKKFHSEKMIKVRELSDIRLRASKRIKDRRRSNREALLNLHRLVEVKNIPEVKKKKTEQEEKLERLRTFKNEKLKRMEEQKKSLKPPFYSLVRARHTGGTPFRPARPMKKPIVTLPPTTRSRTAFQKEFVFKATLSNSTEQTDFNSKLTSSVKSNLIKSTKYKDNQAAKNKENGSVRKKENTAAKNNFKVTIQESLLKNNLQKSGVLSKTTVSRLDRSKVNKSDKNINQKSNVFELLKGKNGVKCKPNAPLKTATNKSQENLIKRVNLNSKWNKDEDIGDLLACNTSKQVIIMTPLVDNKAAKLSSEKLPNPTAESFKISNTESKSEKNDYKVGENEKNMDSSNVETTELRNKLDEETDRLNKIADIWSLRHMEENIPESAKDEILAVVGQTRLLISDKFQQFRSLICNAQANHEETSMIIKFDDLLGFWEMVYLEVDQLNKKYDNLEMWKSTGWVSNDKELPIKKNKIKVKNTKSSKPSSSNFRAFLKKKREDKFEGERIDKIQFEGTPIKKTPVKRLLDSECRRSSASTITLQKCFLAKAILSPYKKA